MQHKTNVGTPSLILEDEKSATAEVCKLFCCGQVETIKDFFSVKIGTRAQMLNFFPTNPVGVRSEHPGCLKMTPCTPVVMLDGDNFLVFPCA